MKTSIFDFHLPVDRIAQRPLSPRDHSRLMILKRGKQTIEHDRFYNLDKYLKRGDVLVFNNSKVFPARLIGKKIPTKGKMEVFLLRPVDEHTWLVILGGKGKKKGLEIVFPKKLTGVVIDSGENNTWKIRFSLPQDKLMPLLDVIGKTPTPPYIKQKTSLKKYQTLYAKHVGSVAAPTAGFHFTNRVFKKLQKIGVVCEYVTLHVGLGTFKPITSDTIEEHHMHAEWCEVSQKTAKSITRAKKEGRRIIPVGTTSLRTLEAFATQHGLSSGKKWVNIYIKPGYAFKLASGMVTNFHTPKSSLIVLVSALAGRDFIFKAYHQALQKDYRFYSFGDGMLIL